MIICMSEESKQPDGEWAVPRMLDQQILTPVMSSPLKEKWRMLWAFQLGELNARCKPIASYDDAGCLEVDN
jgi:hypothetical protein